MDEEKVKGTRGRKKGSVVNKEPELAIADPLIHPYKIYIDPRCFSVVEINSKVGGFEKPYGYFPTFQGALKKIVSLKTLSDSQITTIEQFINTFNDNLKLFSEKIKI